jgi:hypothetical protein
MPTRRRQTVFATLRRYAPTTLKREKGRTGMSKPVPQTEDEILEAMKRSWEADFHFFSNRGKEERERWVVTEFLSRLTIPFSIEELSSDEQSSKVDVIFRDARFQIKEIVVPNRKRGDEIRATYNLVMTANKLAETIGPSFVYDVPPPVNGYELIRERVNGLSAKYGTDKRTLDLLFYVTRTYASIVKKNEIDAEELSLFGWRSISCLMGNHACVLFAQPDAPSFLVPKGLDA